MNNISTLNNNFQFRYVFSKKDTRLFYTVDKTLSKPFNLKIIEHRTLLNKMKYEITKKIENGNNDNQIYTFIHDFLNEQLYPIDKYPNNENDDRSDNRVDDIGKLITSIENSPSINNILDIGCSEGGITSKLGEYFGLDSKNIFGVDIRTPKSIDGFTFLLSDPNKIHFPFEDNSISIITILMVLHHTYKPEKIILEASRVLKTGGVLLIREHDIDSDNDIDGKTFLDILHGLYCISWAKYGEQENPNFCDNYYGIYQSRDKWNDIIHQYNLELQLTNEDLKYFYNICKVKREYVNYKWIKNPYHYYYALYIKK